MSNEEVCFICDRPLSADLVYEVKERGIKKIVECSTKRNDDKGTLLSGLSSVTVHQKCYKRYTNEKNVAVAVKRLTRPAPELRPAPEMRPDGIPQRTKNDFNFKNNCLFCEGEISENFLKKELTK